MHNGWYVVGSLLVWIGVVEVLKRLVRHVMRHARAKGTRKVNGDNANVGT